MKILLAVDGSEYSIKAAQYLATHFDWFRGTPELHLLHVKLPIPEGLAAARARELLGDDVIKRYYEEEARAALASAEEILRKHNIPFQSTFLVGDVATEIWNYATRNKMDQIAMGSHGHGALKGLVMGSVAARVLAIAKDIAVLIVR